MPSSWFEGAQMAKMRSLNDFLLGGDKYKLPESLEKWNKRSAQNLIYYQTNYLQVVVTLFLLIGYCSPAKFFTGMISIAIALGLLLLGVQKREELRNIQVHHPMLFLLLILFCSYSLVYLFDAVAVFMISLLVPLMIILIHASLRIRNLGNTIEKGLEKAGIRKTYMGVFLKYLDIVSESIFD